MSPTRVKKFWVFNPDKKVDMKFQELLGPTTKYRYEFHETTFTQAIQSLLKEPPYLTFLKMRNEELKDKR